MPANEPSAWWLASRWIAAWGPGHRLEDLGPAREWLQLPPAGRRIAHRIVRAAVQHASLHDAVFKRLSRRQTNPRVQGVVLAAAAEALSDPGAAWPQVVDHAVRQARGRLREAELGFINAVLRRWPEERTALLRELAARPQDASALALQHSHPEWLVERWLGRFGLEDTVGLLRWNQSATRLHGRWRLAEEAPPPWLTPGAVPGFHTLASGAPWSEVAVLLDAGKLYLQSPATQVSVRLLAPRAGERILDLCAAPGGKSIQIADAMGTGGTGLVCADLPGERLDRLKSNLGAAGLGAAVVRSADLDRRLDGAWADAFTGVLVDVPCSNTGVLQHKAEVKWRLRSGEPEALARRQLAWLERAAVCVAPGGRLVYSTCSLEEEENGGVVRAFLAGEVGRRFTLETETLVRPWVDAMDGAAAYRLVRRD